MFRRKKDKIYSKMNESVGADGNEVKKDTHNDLLVNWVFIGVLIVVAFLVCWSGWMFIESCKSNLGYKEYHDKWMSTRDSLYSNLIHPDSVLIGLTPIKNPQISKENNPNGENKENNVDVEKYLISKSDVTRIQESQRLLFMRQDQLTDDIRQETNNMINKMNGWLGFWMGVMAILGVFVPIALQLKLYRENRDYDTKLRQDYKDELNRLRIEINNYKTECENVQRTEQAELKAERLKIETEINKRLTELEKEYKQTTEELKITQFTAIVRSFHNIVDSPEINTKELRYQLLEKNWDEIVKQVKKFIDYYTSEEKSTKQESCIVNSYSMSVILVQVASVLTSLRLLIPRRRRKLETLATESYDLVKNLNSTPIDTEKLILRLLDYQESLANLHPLTF